MKKTVIYAYDLAFSTSAPSDEVNKRINDLEVSYFINCSYEDFEDNPPFDEKVFIPVMNFSNMERIWKGHIIVNFDVEEDYVPNPLEYFEPSTPLISIPDIVIDSQEITLTRKLVTDQIIAMADDFMFPILDGKKVCTLRKGRRDYQLGDVAFSFEGIDIKLPAQITKIEYMKLEDVDLDVVKAADHVGLLREMREYYPDLEMDTEMTLVSFKFVGGK